MERKGLEEAVPPKAAGAEGELFRVVSTFGRSFELRYGYYSDIDRHAEPVVIYPDFISEPIYTDDGEPFSTMVQDACNDYRGQTMRTEDTTCSECEYFKRGEEWFGICICDKRRRRE